MIVSNKEIQTKLTKGLLDLIILQLLETNPMHGYELMVTIRKSFGVRFGASTIYPVLNAMLKKKYLKCEWTVNDVRPRKIFKLTAEGKSMLDYTASSLRVICKNLSAENINMNNDIGAVGFKLPQDFSKKEFYTVY